MVAAFALVWATARPLVGALGALVAVLIIDGLHYFHFTAAKFNHDVIQLPFWALAGYAFHRALRGRRRSHWLLLGLAVGLALWAKYFVVVLAVPLALFCCSTATPASAWRRPAPRSRSPSRLSSWRRIWSGWCRTISCPSPMPSTARRRRAG